MIALVTGAGRGVGAGIARRLAAAGAAVAVNDLHDERAEAVAAELCAGGATAVAVPFDVADAAAVCAGVAAAAADLGPLDVLVNNAGVPEGRRTVAFEDSVPERDWVPYVELNVYGVLNCVHAVLGGMCARGFGRIVQISSGAAARGQPLGQSVYGGSKAFGDGFLRHLALEVAARGVTVNAVAAGTMTNVRDHLGEAETAAIAAANPTGRLAEPAEIGDAVAWLASPAAAYVTGQVIHVNGGSYQGR